MCLIRGYVDSVDSGNCPFREIGPRTDSGDSGRSRIGHLKSNSGKVPIRNKSGQLLNRELHHHSSREDDSENRETSGSENSTSSIKQGRSTESAAPPAQAETNLGAIKSDKFAVGLVIDCNGHCSSVEIMPLKVESLSKIHLFFAWL